ncbi:hypothetical protein BU25DRAFT_450496 [Macroventuria anomochaeta]|uniref:Uncharacterized protein n=1 Tax=Macroventuria anomochaeta TaxID=301207 RepID=A0ACB6RTM2_9PLEO|nr:uncharacterized protein BU25DRAFT_450496 [Macroventuria anomochaeta]KAF2624760.1 hypothetical protein BU25DRAFT_450496 [Macroventuria anomochaeta]
MASMLILSTIIGLALAQQGRTMTLPNVYGDANSVAASVVTANPSATTFALACIEADCGLFPAHTLVVGPSTYNVDMSDPNTDFTATQDCALASNSAVCKETAGGSEANFPGSSTTTYEGTEIGKLTVTVTAGEDKLVQTGSMGGASSAIAQTSTHSASKNAETASITPAPVSGSAAVSASASRTGSAPAQVSAAGAAINAMVLGGGFVGAAAALARLSASS